MRISNWLLKASCKIPKCKQTNFQTLSSFLEGRYLLWKGRDTMRKYKIPQTFSFSSFSKRLLTKRKMSSQNCHFINQDTITHQFCRNGYFMEFNHEGRQLSHSLEDLDPSFIILLPSRSFNSIDWISSSARDYTVFSEGKPGL